MQAGLARIDITPPVGTPLTGYIARDNISTGVHDPLYAKALVLADGAARVALLTCDVLGLRYDFVTSVRSAIQAATGIPADHILIACSHTHAGPASIFLQDCGDVDEVYLATLRTRLIEVSGAALADLAPARFGVANGQVTAGVHNRRRPGAVIDPALDVLAIRNGEGTLRGAVLNYACHPTCLTGENRLFSAEYCGYATAQIEQATGAVALFVTGAIGDVGPVKRGWPVLEALGRAVAGEAMRVLAAMPVGEWQGVAAAESALELPLLPLPSVAEMEQEAARWQTTETVDATALLPSHPKIPVAMRHWSASTLAALRTGSAPTAVKSAVQVIRAGELTLVSAPGELFVELGLAIKAGCGGNAVFVCGFGNDNVGYIPTRAAYPLGGYEVSEAYKYYGYPAALAPEAGEQLVAEARRLCAMLAS